MAAFRESMLYGTRAAGDLLRDLNIDQNSKIESSRIEVFDVASELGIAVMFRKLDGLMGAYIPGSQPGIIITTQRTRPIQRFTAAHELGHYFMQHDMNLDDEYDIGLEVGKPVGKNDMEIQANAFAAAFLMPRWLLLKHWQNLHKAGVQRESPLAIYQLALRVGCSFQSTVSTLKNYKLISDSKARQLFSFDVKSIKQSILHGKRLDNWKRDIWLLNEFDRGLILEASPNDYFMLSLREASTSGYLVDSTELENMGFTVHSKNEFPTQNDDLIGGYTKTELLITPNYVGSETIEVYQSRPWNIDDRLLCLKAELQISENLPGLSAREREVTLQRLAA